VVHSGIVFLVGVFLPFLPFVLLPVVVD